MAFKGANGHLFKRELMAKQKMKRAEDEQLAKNFRRQNFDRNASRFAHDNSYNGDTRVKAPGRESSAFANKGKRKLPFSDASYMGSYSPIEPDPTPGTGSYTTQLKWSKDAHIQSSMFSSKTKSIDLFNNTGFFEVSTPRDTDWTAPGRSKAGAIDRATRQTDDWLILGTQGDRSAQSSIQLEDDWGSFNGMSDVIKKLGDKLEQKKTTLAVKLLLKLEGVLLTEETLEKLFGKVQAQIAARKYRLQMAYGDMYLKQELRYPETLNRHVTKIGPGEYYDVANDPLSCAGRVKRGDVGGVVASTTSRCPPQDWAKGGATSSKPDGGRTAMLNKKIAKQRHEKLLARRKYLKQQQKNRRREARQAEKKSAVNGIKESTKVRSKQAGV